MWLSIALGALVEEQAVSTTPSTATISSAAHKTTPASKEAGKEGESPLAGPLQVAAESSFAEKTTFQLLRWMFSFLKPVKSLAVTACSLLIVWITIDILITRQMGRAVDLIKVIHVKETATNLGFWQWISSPDTDAAAYKDFVAEEG